MSDLRNRKNALLVKYDQLVVDHGTNMQPLNRDRAKQYAINILLDRQVQPIRVTRVRRQFLGPRVYTVRLGYHRTEAFRILLEEGIPLAELKDSSGGMLFDLEKMAQRPGRKGTIRIENDRVYYSGPIEVDVIHEKTSTSSELRRLRLSENLMRAEPDPISEARAFHELITSDGYSPAAIAILYGMAEATVQERLGLLKLPEDIQKKLQSGKKSLSWVLANYNLQTGQKLQKRNGSDLRARGKRALQTALKAAEENPCEHNLFKGMTSDQLEIAKKVLRWARGEEV